MTDSRVKRTFFFSTKMYHFKDFILFYACKVGKKIALILLGYIYILCKKKKTCLFVCNNIVLLK